MKQRVSAKHSCLFIKVAWLHISDGDDLETDKRISTKRAMHQNHKGYSLQKVGGSNYNAFHGSEVRTR
jgi:hypothetical protein